MTARALGVAGALAVLVLAAGCQTAGTRGLVPTGPDATAITTASGPAPAPAAPAIVDAAPIPRLPIVRVAPRVVARPVRHSAPAVVPTPAGALSSPSPTAETTAEPTAVEPRPELVAPVSQPTAPAVGDAYVTADGTQHAVTAPHVLTCTTSPPVITTCNGALPVPRP